MLRESGGVGEEVEGWDGDVKDGGAGDEAGEGGDGGGGGGDGGEDSPNVVLRAVSSPAHRIFSGVVLSLEPEADRRAAAAAVPLFLARTVALWLARVAVKGALVRFRARGLAL